MSDKPGSSAAKERESEVVRLADDRREATRKREAMREVIELTAPRVRFSIGNVGSLSLINDSQFVQEWICRTASSDILEPSGILEGEEVTTKAPLLGSPKAVDLLVGMPWGYCRLLAKN